MRPINPPGSYKIQHPELRDPSRRIAGGIALSVALFGVAVLIWSLLFQAVELSNRFEMPAQLEASE